ncbi:dual specificity protein phosphatase 12 [Nannochloropsis gaditana]|uniref:protein-tyrosine-phosphatase n=1 Tax=Nannochloropsis gaditana TaxID=72520 RepID=W7TR75_9STRA|nr:dual specificity protein phosphatase 12 [Nannochloropsis gaditana]
MQSYSKAEDNLGVDVNLLVFNPPLWPPSPRFYVGGVSAAYASGALQLFGLTHLLSLGVTPAAHVAAHFTVGRTSLCLPDLLDVEDQDLLSAAPSLLAFLSATTSSDSILVHCQAGQSRSIAAVLMYLIVCKGMDLVDAHAQIARCRPQVCVNAGFLRQLLFLEDFVARDIFYESLMPRLVTRPLTHNSHGHDTDGILNRTGCATQEQCTSSGLHSCQLASEHRLYILGKRIQTTCQLSSLDAGSLLEEVEEMHRALIDQVRLYFRGACTGKHRDPTSEEREEGMVRSAERGKTGGQAVGWVARCRHCGHVLCTEEEEVRHSAPDFKASRVFDRVKAIGRAAPEAEKFRGYLEAFERRPLLHLSTVPYAILKQRRKRDGRTDPRRAVRGDGIPDIQQKDGRRPSAEISSASREGSIRRADDREVGQGCQYMYAYPRRWSLASLLGGGTASGSAVKPKDRGVEGGGTGGDFGGSEGMRSLRCPGRHCGVIVGATQARVGEVAGSARGGEACECMEALPMVVVRFRRGCLRIDTVTERRSAWSSVSGVNVDV